MTPNQGCLDHSLSAEPHCPHGGIEAVSVNLVDGPTKCEDLEIQMDRACQVPTRCL